MKVQAPPYQERHLENLVVSCPQCGGTLARYVYRQGRYEDGEVFDVRIEDVFCRQCGRWFGHPHEEKRR